MPPSPDDDLQKYLTKQPPKLAKPRREVTSLTFSLTKWQQANRWYSRPLPPVGQWPWWIWAAVPTVAILAALPVKLPPSMWQLSRGGEISEENLANFPPPSPYQQITTDGQAVVVITNGSPEPMRIGLKGEKDYAFEVPPCRDCTYTENEELVDKFCDRGPEQVLYITPGDYEVTVGFGGTISYFRSGWTVAAGWEYRQCIYGR